MPWDWNCEKHLSSSLALNDSCRMTGHSALGCCCCCCIVSIGQVTSPSRHFVGCHSDWPNRRKWEQPCRAESSGLVRGDQEESWTLADRTSSSYMTCYAMWRQLRQSIPRKRRLSSNDRLCGTPGSSSPTSAVWVGTCTRLGEFWVVNSCFNFLKDTLVHWRLQC